MKLLTWLVLLVPNPFWAICVEDSILIITECRTDSARRGGRKDSGRAVLTWSAQPPILRHQESHAVWEMSMRTRTGGFRIGFRRGWSDGRKTAGPGSWAKDVGFEAIDLGHAAAADIGQVRTAAWKSSRST